MTNMQYEAVAENERRSFIKLALSWDEEVAIFGKAGATIVLPEDVVEARLAGYDGFTRTRLIPIKAKSRQGATANTILYKGPELGTPLGAREIVSAHSIGKYPSRPREFYDQAEALAKSEEGKEPEDRTAIIVSQNGNHSWNEDMLETRFTLGPLTKKYFAKKVKPFGRTEIPFYDLSAPSSADEANFNYVWFNNPLDDSRLVCRVQDLHNHYYALGVLEKTAAGGSRPTEYANFSSIKMRTPEAVARYLKQRKLDGLTELLAGLSEEIVRGLGEP